MLTIRTAKIEDVTVLKSLICELAEYEHEPDSVVLTEEDLRRDGFCGNPRYRVLLAEWNGEPVGYALFFGIYSSWDGPGIFLEDLFVRPSFRKREIGRSLMSAVARIAKQENCFGIRWEVLDWNSPAIAFYKSIGAEFLEQWRGASLKGKALRHLAKEV